MNAGSVDDKDGRLGAFAIGSSIEKGQVYDDLGEGYQTVTTVPIVYVVH